jgi:hypothetical protein
MKINLKSTKLVPLASILFGQGFSHLGVMFLHIQGDNDQLLTYGGDYLYGVNLSMGKLTIFGRDAYVTPVNLEVNEV